jgi:Zn-dependent M28 family amino/carboxypeptidase
MTSPAAVTRRLAACLIAIAPLVACGCAARRPPSLDPVRATTLQQEVVSKLAGSAEIRPGLKVANRTAIEYRREVRAYLAALLTRLGLEPKRHDYSAEGQNVYAILACDRPSAAAIVLGAHYDSARNSPGANDDASGVAAVAAVADHLRRVKQRTRDVIVVFFDEEERGLRGSRAFAQMLQDEHRPVHSVHTIDQMGWDQDGDRAIELEIPYDGATALYAKAAEALGLRIVMHTTTEAGSDHSAFRRLGFKAVGITEEYRNKDTTPHIHRPGDTVDTIDFAYLLSSTSLLGTAIEMLATGRW